MFFNGILYFISNNQSIIRKYFKFIRNSQYIINKYFKFVRNVCDTAITAGLTLGKLNALALEFGLSTAGEFIKRQTI